MRKGFSLVELSIVLVILGLLVGGILAGQSLIRASELRSVQVDVQKYITAAHAFRDKYFGLAGDLANAESIWGTADDCTGSYLYPATDLRTCNGTGEGVLITVERYRAWQHLTNAGLLEGRYTGVPYNSSSASMRGGVNIPNSKLGGAALQFVYIPDIPAAALFAEPKQHALFFLGSMNSTISVPNPVLRPEETWNIDTKMDDGKPASGKWMHYDSDSSTVGTCVTGNVASTADYDLALTTISCAPYYTLGY